MSQPLFFLPNLTPPSLLLSLCNSPEKTPFQKTPKSASFSMVKEMRFDWDPWSLRKHNHLFVKIGVLIMLMGLAFRLFLSSSVGVSPVTEAPFVGSDVLENSIGSETTMGSVQAPNVADPERPQEKCDIFDGDWIPNPSGPIYTNESCHVVEDHQNCMKNGRPDLGYLYWKWSPRNCEMHRFDAEKFLELMRNKHWAFVGDSISRNHVQSLLCILSKVEAAVEVYHDKEYKSKRWLFPDYNFTLSVVWSPFLVKASIFEDINGVSTDDIQLHLDKVDKKWADQYENIDYMIFSGGKWFLKTAIYYENNKIVGCHYCPKRNLTELGFDNAYRRTLQLVFNFIIKSHHKRFVFFRTITPDHFEGGEWFSGGTCVRKVPFKEGEVSLRDIDVILRNVELEEFEKFRHLAIKNGVKLKLLDTTHLSLLRPDGHPGPYRQFHPFAKSKDAKVQNDCLHWCLPGPIDSWNDLMMEMVVNS